MPCQSIHSNWLVRRAAQLMDSEEISANTLYPSDLNQPYSRELRQKCLTPNFPLIGLAPREHTCQTEAAKEGITFGGSRRRSFLKTISESLTAREKSHTSHAELTSFGSSIGVLLSCLGCVVGTGNIWRFPRIIATASSPKGSLTFLIAWVLSLFVWSLPLSIVEYSLGRFTRTSPLGAFHKFLGNKLIWLGGWIVGVTYMITAYFSVIVGWCLYYFYKSCALPSLPLDEVASVNIFNEFARDSYWPVLFHTLAVLIVAGCIFGGIRWIEKANMFLVPMLLGILLFTFGWSLTRQYSEVGITFIFTPEWSSMLTPSVWVQAATQNAFDTGAAMALFVSYSAYFTRKNGAVRFGSLVPLVNNSVSLLCAVTVFSTVFSTLIQTSPELTRLGILEIMQQNGPGSTGLTFTWIPVLFAHVEGIGRVLCSLFFLCLSFAGVTSLIGHVQLTVITLKDLGLSHRKASFGGLALTLIFGMPSAISINVLTNQDAVWGFALMLSGLAMAALILVYGPLRYRKVVVNDFGIDDWKLSIVWVFMISVLVPFAGIGLIVWWAYEGILSDKYWYHLTLDSVMTTLLEWGILFVVLLIANGIALWRKKELFPKNKFVGYDPHNPDYELPECMQSNNRSYLVVFAQSTEQIDARKAKSSERTDF
ncbi:uncharacterized sodium-dependent transporter MJ1319 [Clonorchis sinensis]|uniref:Uncharacterized sodium-dependent transporter MJ1319 n=1 Tax=Clonorchis sinensis TaxID=79923 RepID=H2KTT8_CLOSI|nr:uncharacterized sodium-dependent transporter MJ1319 [Clonorchis sinensis]